MSAADGLDQVAKRLYSLPPGDFVAARDDAVAGARAVGDREGASAIAKLRRPTVAAWLVNLLVMRRPDLVDELIDLGRAMRTAQTELRGSALRDLAAQRRAAIGAMVGHAVDFAVEAGAARLGLPTAEVEATFSAAMADDAIADDVRGGRLLKAAQYAGFGELQRPALHVVKGGLADETPRRPKVDQSGVRQRLSEARSAMSAAESATTHADEVAMRASQHVDEVEASLAQLRRERVAAHAARNEAETQRIAAAQALEAAKRALAAAERAANRAKPG